MVSQLQGLYPAYILKWEDDCKLGIGRDMEGNGHGIFEDAIPECWRRADESHK
jgi:hypothetical protein